ncbi:10967_t:CDS:2 [Acaulospora colombiana]|uniref:10967_t:CDS:1 n=1 Tax=Acaulospora colombiana TaxID=27376 RepID=A0ACA9KQP8_9GLOM|nr:10967_t:CDS:2 [Acaulospora colombiana]
MKIYRLLDTAVGCQNCQEDTIQSFVRKDVNSFRPPSPEDDEMDSAIDVPVSTPENPVSFLGLRSPSLSPPNQKIPPPLTRKEDLLLDNADLWEQFYKVDNEMIITKSGRCIFPLLKFNPVSLDSTARYTFVLDFTQVSPSRYRFKKGDWVSIGIDKRKFSTSSKNGKPIRNGKVDGRPYTHPDSPQSGAYWARFGVFFPKIKLTNRPRHNLSSCKSGKRGPRVNGENESAYDLPDGHFCLTSFHKYQPRVRMIKHSSSTSREDKELIFTFRETTFIAVTHYQNDAVNTLKKNYNPHAKGFKDMENHCPIGGYSEESDNEVDSNGKISPQGETTPTPSHFATSPSQSTSDLTLDHSTLMSINEPPEFSNRTGPNGLRRSSTKGSPPRQVTINDPGNRVKVVKNIPLATNQKQKVEAPPPIAIPIGGSLLDVRSSPNPTTNFTAEGTPRFNGSTLTLPEGMVVQGLHTPITPFGSIVSANEFPWDRSPPFDNERSENISTLDLKSKQLNFHASPVTPVTPENDYFSTSASTNVYTCRLKHAENENRKLREFIRERYGAEAEKEADVVVAFGSNDESH